MDKNGLIRIGFLLMIAFSLNMAASQETPPAAGLKSLAASGIDFRA